MPVPCQIACLLEAARRRAVECASPPRLEFHKPSQPGACAVVAGRRVIGPKEDAIEVCGIPCKSAIIQSDQYPTGIAQPLQDWLWLAAGGHWTGSPLTRSFRNGVPFSIRHHLITITCNTYFSDVHLTSTYGMQSTHSFFQYKELTI